MSSPQPALRHSREHFVHVIGGLCPICDQPIPNEKAEEARRRIEARDKALSETAKAEAARQFAAEKARIDAANRELIDRVRKESADAFAKVTSEMEVRVASARDEARKAAETASQVRIAGLEQAVRDREAGWQEKIAAAESEKQGAVTRYEALKADHENELGRRVLEVREALDRDKAEAVNAAKAAHAAETQKLTGKLEDLTRQLEKKTTEELGEGAEVKLFESLREEFPNDRIERVGKGNSGADILHTVIHNGRECGTIVYDSKNTTAWRNDYVTKLVQDQTAAKADHAILSVLKFPADAKQLEIREGVIIVNPARAIAVVQIVRRHMILVHSLRLSKTERTRKMAALYDLITSERFGHLLGRIESHSEALLEMQAKEIKAHEDHWKKEGTHVRSIQKVKAELETEIDRIIGADDCTD
jgi:hypothetical protein